MSDVVAEVCLACEAEQLVGEMNAPLPWLAIDFSQSISDRPEVHLFPRFVFSPRVGRAGAAIR